MLGLIQRVSSADVRVTGKRIAEIARGSLVLVGVQPEDTPQTAERLGEKLLKYRLFADASGKTNLSVIDIEGGILLVPQFTLAANTQKGLRPSFSSAAKPDIANQLFQHLFHYCQSKYHNVQQGQFGADMQVSLCNDGPVTFLLEVN